MKKRILSLALVLCMVLPMIPFSAISLSAAAVDGLYYDSAYARDVVFGDVPVSSYYTGQAGSLYEDNFNANLMNMHTKYKTYMELFDTMVDYDNSLADIIIDAGNVHTSGYDAGKWYNDIPATVRNSMNATTAGGYVTRQVLAKACKDISTIYNWVDPAKNEFGVDLADRPTEYVYAYTFDPTQEEGYVGPDNLPKLIIATGNQSDEKGAIYGTYYLLYDILYNWDKSPVLNYLRHNVKLVIVPCLSPGGFNQLSYWNANFVNVNRNFESDGSSFIPRLTGGYGYKEQAGGDWVPGTLNASGSPIFYTQVEEGTGTHVQIYNINGIYNKDGSDARDSRYQNAGYAAFDQSEACALRDLFEQNLDAFYYGDFHTNTSGPLEAGDWVNVNWLAYGEIPDEAYYQKLINLADWHIERFSRETIKNYNLAQFGVGENQKLSHYNTSKAGYTSKDCGKSYNILSTTLEGISGFPGGVLGGRYSPMAQKLDSEILGNWLIGLLGEYAYDGNLPTVAYTTSFAPFNENYPTIENMPLKSDGKYDSSGLAQPSSGFKALSSYTDENGNPLYNLVWNGGWVVGQTKLNGDGSFKPFSEGTFTPYEVYVQANGSKSLFLAGDTTVWSTSAYLQLDTTQMASSTSSSNYGGASNPTHVWGSDATIRYTVEYDGTITIDVKDIIFNSNMVQLVIMKNGVKIGGVLPHAANSTYMVDGNGNWTSGGSKNPGATTVTVTVKKGDVIDFINHNTNDIEGAYKLTTANMTNKNTAAGGQQQYETIRRGIKKFDISITYYEYAAKDFEESYIGTMDANWNAFPYRSTIDSFLIWTKNGKTVTSGSLAGATATINPVLFKKGWVKEDDTWAQAIEGYLNYLRALPKLISKTGWYPVSYEKAGAPGTPGTPGAADTVASRINRYSFLASTSANILDVNSSGNYSRPLTVSTDADQYVVSETYYEAQLTAYAYAATLFTVEGQGKGITVSYDNDVSPIKSKFNKIGGPNTTPDIGNAVTFLNYNTNTSFDGSGTYRGTLMRMHGDLREGAMVYEMPAGVHGGLATVTLDGLYIPTDQLGRNIIYSVYLNDQVLIAEKTVSSTNLQASLADALKDDLGAFEVNAGDLLQIRFKRPKSTSAVFVAPALTIKVQHPGSEENPYTGETWDGTPAAVTKTEPTNYQTLFKWYNPAGEEGTADDLLVAGGGTINSDGYVVLNPYFTNPNATHNYKITADMTYGEAVEVYKQYLRDLSDIVSKNNWQIGAMVTAGSPYSTSGSDFSPVTKLSFLTAMNIYAVTIKEVKDVGYVYGGTYKSGWGAEVWVTEQYFEENMNVYCCDYTWSQVGGTWTKVTDNVNLIPYETKIGDFNDTTLTYQTLVDTHALLDVEGVTAGTNGGAVHSWVANGSERNPYNYTSHKDTNYKGIMLRPAYTGNLALGYTVPAEAAGQVFLRLNSLTYGNNGSTTQYNGVFQWKVKINGVDQTNWATYTPVSTTMDSGDALAAINYQLANLHLSVKAGDMVQFCIKRHTSSAIYVSPSISVLPVNENEDVWTGNYGADAVKKKPGTYQTFFVWIDANGNQVADTGNIENAYAIVNPWLITNGYVKTTDTYAEALQGYKTYLRTVTALPIKNGWQLSGMQSKENIASYGETIVPLCYGDFLGLNNIFGIHIKETSSGNSYVYSYDVKYRNYTSKSFDVWVTADFFELQLKLLCDEVVYNKTTGKLEAVTAPVIPWDTLISTMDTKGTDTQLTYSYITTTATTATPGSSYAVTNHVSYAWNANGGVWPFGSVSLVAEQESKAAYKGMILRPQSGKGAALTYTVPDYSAGGYAKLRLNGLAFGDWGSSSSLYNGTFSWAIAINDEVVTGWYTATESGDLLYEDASHSRVAAINEKLAELELLVNPGDRVSFCVKNIGNTFYISPSIAIEIVEGEFVPQVDAMHLVEITTGGEAVTTLLVKHGTNLIDVLNTARVKTVLDKDYAEYGCYVNGKWYNVASLPPITSDTVIDDVKIEVSASLTIGATYSVNVFLPSYNGATAAGVKIYGKNYEAKVSNGGFTVVVKDQIYTKDLLDFAVCYTPYYVINGKEVLGAETLTLRAKDLLNTYINDPAYAKEKDVAQAALDYATVAKAYDKEKTVNADILARLAAYDAEITGASADKLNKTGDVYTFKMATLELGDTVNFIFAIAMKDGSNLTAFNGRLTVKGTGVATNEFLETSIGGQKMLIAVIAGVPEAEFAKTQTFVLEDASGNAVASVDYSVKNYCVRTLATAIGTPEADIIRAVYAIGKAAEAYNA